MLGFALVGLLVALQLEALHRQNLEKARLLRDLEATQQEMKIMSQQAGVAQERQRLAYEIHDTFAQSFTSIIMQVEAAESRLPAPTEMVQHSLDQIRQTARENLTEARRLMWALQPEPSQRASLPATLSHLCHTWSEEQGVTATLIITGEGLLLRPEIEVILLRAAQEGLINVRKHDEVHSFTHCR